MGIKAKRAGIAAVACGALAIGGVGLANAASTSSTSTTTHHAGPPMGGNPNETSLTGATLTSASAAATAAVPGGTVEHATTEDPKDPSGAAYEVHVKKTDGSQVEVLEDSSFKVLSVKAGGPGGPGGPGHRGGPLGTPLTGATLSSASAAAIAAVPGGKVDHASALPSGDPSGAAYIVDVTKSDGSRVDVLEDSAFKVLSVKTPPAGGPHGGPGGPGGPPPAGH
jgi:hypothetical protein